MSEIMMKRWSLFEDLRPHHGTFDNDGELHGLRFM
jgi:hypothetical protein